MGLLITIFSLILLTITSVITSNPQILNDLRSRADVGPKSSTYNTSTGGYSSSSSKSSSSTNTSSSSNSSSSKSSSSSNSSSSKSSSSSNTSSSSNSSSSYSNSSYPYASNYTAPASSSKPAASSSTNNSSSTNTSIRAANDETSKPSSSSQTSSSTNTQKTTTTTTIKTEAQEIAELKKDWLKTRGVDGALSSTPKVTAPTAATTQTKTNTTSSYSSSSYPYASNYTAPTAAPTSPAVPTPVVKTGGIGDKPRNLDYMKDDYVDPTTGVKNNSSSTCGDSEGFVSGTYCSGGSRHVVAIDTTQKAYSEFLKTNSDAILSITDDQLLAKAKTDFGVSCSSSDYACQKTAIAKAQTKVLDEMIVVGKTTRDAISTTRTAIQATSDFSDISKPLDAFIAKYGSETTTGKNDSKTAGDILTKILTDAGFKTDTVTKMVSDRQILSDYVDPNISDYEFAKRNGCDSTCQQYGGAASREAWLKAKTGITGEQVTLYNSYLAAQTEKKTSDAVRSALSPLLTSTTQYDADVISDKCKSDQSCKDALYNVLLFTSNKKDSQVISEFCKENTTCLNNTKNREDILRDYSKYITTDDAKLISQTYIDNRTKLVTDAVNSYASIKSDSQLARESCGNNFGCIDRFTRESALSNLNPTEKVAVQAAYEQTVAKLAQLIPQVINTNNKKAVDSGKTIQVGGLTIDKSTYEHISDINSKVEHAYWVYRSQTSNIPGSYITATDQATEFSKIIAKDPAKILELSSKFDQNPAPYLGYAENRQFKKDQEFNAVVVNKINTVIKNTSVKGLYENGTLLPWNKVSDTYKQQVRDLALKDMPYANYAGQCASSYGTRACTKEEINQRVDAFIAGNENKYLNEILRKEKGTSTLSLTQSNVVSLDNKNIDIKLREEALAAAQQKIDSQIKDKQVSYQGTTYTIPGSTVVDTSWTNPIHDLFLTQEQKDARKVNISGSNDTQIQQLVNQMATEYLNRRLVEETYTRGTGVSGALTLGAAGGIAGGAACTSFAPGVGTVGCGIVGGVVGGLSGVISTFVPILGEATAEEIEAERKYLAEAIGSDMAGSIAQSLYSNQGALAYKSDGSLSVGRSFTTKDNQFGLLDAYSTYFQNNGVTTDDINTSNPLAGQMAIQPTTLSAWEENQQRQQNIALASIPVAAITGGLSGGTGALLANTIFNTTGATVISTLTKNLAQDVTLFAGGEVINAIQNSAQFNYTAGDKNLLTTQAQIDLKTCEQQNGVGSCNKQEKIVKDETSAAYVNNMVQALATDTIIQVGQSSVSFAVTANQLSKAKNAAIATNIVAPEVTSPTTKADIQIAGSKFYDRRGTEHTVPESGYLVFGYQSETRKWVSISPNETDKYNSVVLVPKNYRDTANIPSGIPKDVQGIANSLNNGNQKLITDIGGVTIDPKTITDPQTTTAAVAQSPIAVTTPRPIPTSAPDNTPLSPPLVDPNQAGIPGNNSTITNTQPDDTPQLVVVDPLQPIDSATPVDSQPAINAPEQTNIADTAPVNNQAEQPSLPQPAKSLTTTNLSDVGQSISNGISSAGNYIGSKLNQLGDWTSNLLKPKENNQKPTITQTEDVENLDITIGLGMKVSDIPDKAPSTISNSDYQLGTLDRIINADLLNRAKKLGVPDNQTINSIKLQVESIESFISNATGKSIPEIRKMNQSELDSTIRSAGRISDSKLVISNIDNFGRVWYDGQNLVSETIENFRVTTRSPDSIIVSKAANAGIPVEGKTIAEVKAAYDQAINSQQISAPTLSTDPFELTGDLPTLFNQPKTEPIPTTNEKLNRTINSNEQRQINSAAKDKNNSILVRDLLSDPIFQPKRAVDIDGKTFYLSDVIPSEKGYEYAVMYVKNPSTGEMLPRVLYKSNSDGGWRSSPGAQFTGYGEIYSKGSSIHYTQETKPHPSISRTLENSPSTPVYKGDVVRDKFPLNNPDKQNIFDNFPSVFTYDKEVGLYNDRQTLTDAQQFPPGHYSDHYVREYAQVADFAAAFSDFRYPKDFIPDFSRKPIRSFQTEHTLLGNTTIEIFRGKLNNRTVEWAMARDTQGRVWVDSIYFPDSPITTYGTRAEVINSGAITNKPLEYNSQIGLLTAGKDYVPFGDNQRYSDITPLLNNLEPIKQYRESLANRSTDVQTPKLPIVAPEQKATTNNSPVSSNTNQESTRPNTTIEDVRRSVSSALSAGIEITTTKLGQFLNNLGDRLKASTTKQPNTNATITQHIISPLNLPETQTINRLTNGEPVILYHKLNSPEDLASIHQNGYQNDGWRTNLNSQETTDVMYLSVIPPQDNDPNNVVLQTPKGLKIFDGRNRLGENWTAASLADGSFNGVKYDGYILETSSVKANSNIEVVIIKPNDLDLPNNLQPLSAVQKNRQSPEVAQPISNSTDQTPKPISQMTLSDIGQSITKGINNGSSTISNKLGQLADNLINRLKTATPAPQNDTTTPVSTPKTPKENPLSNMVGQVSDWLYTRFAQSDSNTPNSIGKKATTAPVVADQNIGFIETPENPASITSSRGNSYKDIEPLTNQGNSSIVYRATDAKGQPVIIKLFSIEKIDPNAPSLPNQKQVNANQIDVLQNHKPADPRSSVLPKLIDVIVDNNNQIIGYVMEQISGVPLGDLYKSQGNGLTTEQKNQIKTAIDTYHRETGQVHGYIITTDNSETPLHSSNIIFTQDPNRPVVLLDPSPGIAGEKTMKPMDEQAFVNVQLMMTNTARTSDNRLPILIDDIPSEKSTTNPEPEPAAIPDQKSQNQSTTNTPPQSAINIGVISSIVAVISAVGTAISTAINHATTPQYSNIPQPTPMVTSYPAAQAPQQVPLTDPQTKGGPSAASNTTSNNDTTIKNEPAEVIPAVSTQKTTNQITKDIVNTTINSDPKFGFSRERYEEIKADGIITEQEREELRRNYYMASPDTFVGHGTRLSDKESTYAQVEWLGMVIREQMNGGFVLTGSGQFGYHDELASVLPSWVPTSIYARGKNPNNILMDNVGSTVYYYEREKRYNNSNFFPISYEELTPEQKRLYDLSDPSKGKIQDHFTTPEVQSKMTPQEALDSNKYVGAIATKSPNDVGKEILLFKVDPKTKESTFAGVAIVTDVARRADWIGIGGTTETITGQANANFATFPLATRIDKNGTQWGFDLDNDLYAYMGGTGGPTQPIVGINAEKYEEKISGVEVAIN